MFVFRGITGHRKGTLKRRKIVPMDEFYCNAKFPYGRAERRLFAGITEAHNRKPSWPTL
jgi:hypothetical protein